MDGCDKNLANVKQRSLMTANMLFQRANSSLTVSQIFAMPIARICFLGEFGSTWGRPKISACYYTIVLIVPFIFANIDKSAIKFSTKFSNKVTFFTKARKPFWKIRLWASNSPVTTVSRRYLYFTSLIVGKERQLYQKSQWKFAFW